VTADVIYHGNRDHRRAGPAPIAIETPAGEVTGLLHNHARGKSPDGFAWSYGGSGPAATAKSLLIDALGDRAKCHTCAGTQQIVYGSPSTLTARPFDPARDAAIPGNPDEDGYEGPARFDCPDCDDGYRRLPYQDFKAAFVATWGDEFRISRREILTWLIDHHPGCLTGSEG
jgi:hypothetical protein